jgi:hypothetical protein
MAKSPFKNELKYFVTIGYYPASRSPDPGTNIIYKTFPSPYLALIANIHSTTDKEFNGYQTTFDFKRFFRIEYRNRSGSRRTKWFTVDEFGSREINEQEGNAQLEIIKTTLLANQAFVFYQMGIDQFWDIVSRVAPPLEPPQRRAGFLGTILFKLRSFANRLFSTHEH